MKKVPMIANKEMYFDGDTVPKDGKFKCDEKFEQILTLSGAARRDQDEELPKKRKYSRRDMVAESP